MARLFDMFSSLLLGGAPEMDNDMPGAEKDNTFKPLYENARISVLTSVLLILAYSMHFKLSGAALAHVITLIRLHCPIVNNCIKSLYMFKKFFHGLRPDLKFHYYCNYCCLSPCNKDSTECCNTFCHHGPGKEAIKKDYFLELPIIGQLQSILKRTEIHKDLMHRFERKKDIQTIMKISMMARYTRNILVPLGFSRTPITFHLCGIQMEFQSSKAQILGCGHFTL